MRRAISSLTLLASHNSNSSFRALCVLCQMCATPQTHPVGSEPHTRHLPYPHTCKCIILPNLHPSKRGAIEQESCVNFTCRRYQYHFTNIACPRAYCLLTVRQTLELWNLFSLTHSEQYPSVYVHEFTQQACLIPHYLSLCLSPVFSWTKVAYFTLQWKWGQE